MVADVDGSSVASLVLRFMLCREGEGKVEEIEVVSEEPQEVVEEDGALTFLSPAAVDSLNIAP